MILAALREAERAAQVSVESAVVGMGGPTVRGANSRGVIELGRPREIEQRDVNRVVERASRVQLAGRPHGAAAVPAGFRGGRSSRPPRSAQHAGLAAGNQRSPDHGFAQEHNALVGAVNQAHLVVEETVFEALAACYAAVLPEDRREGIAVVDIGGAIHRAGGVLRRRHAAGSTVPICGDHFTRDLAQALCISLRRRRAGQAGIRLRASPGLLPGEQSGRTAAARRSRARAQAQRRLLNQILEARAEELFQHVRGELARVGHGPLADRRRVS